MDSLKLHKFDWIIEPHRELGGRYKWSTTTCLGEAYRSNVSTKKNKKRVAFVRRKNLAIDLGRSDSPFLVVRHQTPTSWVPFQKRPSMRKWHGPQKRPDRLQRVSQLTEGHLPKEIMSWVMRTNYQDATSSVIIDETCSMSWGILKIISPVLPSCFVNPLIYSSVRQYQGTWRE